MIPTITPVLNSFAGPLTLTCHKCEAEIGIVPTGFGLLFVRVMGVPNDFIGIAPRVDWYRCRQCGEVSTPLLVDPDMLDVTLATVRRFIYVHNPTLDAFREEFPLTPHYGALIKEDIKIRFP